MLASSGATTFVQGLVLITTWGRRVVLTGLITSMAVNALVTGLIVFKILKVFLEVKATSIEQTLGSTGGTTTFRNIIFVIIESGMALFAIQLVRVVIFILPAVHWQQRGLNLIDGINEMFNVIIKSIHF